MASMRSCFLGGNVRCFSWRNCLNFGLNTQKISRYRAAAVSMLHRNTSRHDMHNLATVDATTPHVSLVGPSVRRLLNSYGLDGHSIKPSGHKGQLLKGDVLKYINKHAKIEIKFPQILPEKTPATGQTLLQESNIGYADITVNSTRQAIAQQFVEAKNTIPHTYNTIDCNVDSLIAMCQRFDNSVSVQDFVIKAAALALRAIPSVNSSWSDSGPVQLNHIHIGIDVNSPHGIINSVINYADQLDVSSISQRIMKLTDNAKNEEPRHSQPPNALFTITNLENQGVKSFTSILNAPQSAILTVGDRQVVVCDDYKLSNVINVTLCCDGRIVDEQLAAEWLSVFKDFIENPLQMGL